MKNSGSFLFGIVIIVATRLLTWLSNPQGTLHPDSSTYLPTTWLDFSQVSFFGNSKRGWVVPLFYAILPNNPSRVLFQLFFGACTWIALLYLVHWIFNKSKFKPYLLVYIVILGCSPNVIQFETSILATTFLINFLLILIGLAIFISSQSRISVWNLILFICLAWLNFSLKASNALVVIPLLLWLCIRYFPKQKTTHFIALFSLSALLFIQASYMNLNNNNQWRYTYSSFTMLWHLGAQSPTSLQLTEYLEKHGAPKCLTKDSPYKDIAKSLTRIDRECPEIESYIKSEYKMDVLKFILTNPEQAIRSTSLGMAIALSSTSSHYGTVTTLVPSSLNEFIFGNVTPDFRVSGVSDQARAASKANDREPLWIFIPGLLIFLIFFPINIWRQRKSSIGQVLILTFCILVSEMVLTVLILPSEWFRQNAQYLVALYTLSAFAFQPSGDENFVNRKTLT